MIESFLLLICFYAAVYDFIFYKIPNRIILVLIGAFIANGLFSVMSGVPVYIVIYPVFIATIILFIGILLFSFKVMGAGDAKLIAACSLFIPYEYIYQFVFLIFVSGGILALTYILFKNPLAFVRQLLLAKIVDKSDDQIIALENKNIVPYAIAIFAGLLWTLLINR